MAKRPFKTAEEANETTTMEAKSSSSKKAPQEPKETSGDWFKRQVAEWSVTILMLLFGTTTLVQAFVVPTGSMETTLMIGDHLFVDKLVYAPPGPISGMFLPYRDVERGDIIVFRYPPDIRQNYVKRVIGMPGDRIRVVDKQVVLNGKVLNEPYVQHVRPFIDPYADNFPSEPNTMVDQHARDMLANNVQNGEIVVPAGHYFAMGDNRDNSADSRYWGLVPRENIVGTPTIIFWSYDAPTDRLASGNIDPAHIFDIVTNFFSKTRWDRQFRLVRSADIP